MARIMLVCDNHSDDYLKKTKKVLEKMGHTLILADCYNNTHNIEKEENIKVADVMLVADYHGNVGLDMFLYIYDFAKTGKKIYMIESAAPNSYTSISNHIEFQIKPEIIGDSLEEIE